MSEIDDEHRLMLIAVIVNNSEGVDTQTAFSKIISLA